MDASETSVFQHTARPETSQEKGKRDSDFRGGRERVLLFRCTKGLLEDT